MVLHNKTIKYSGFFFFFWEGGAFREGGRVGRKQSKGKKEDKTWEQSQPDYRSL